MPLPLNFVPERIETFTSAWKKLVPDAVFAGMTLEQFIEATKEPAHFRAEIHRHQTILRGLRTERDQADARALHLLDLVVNSVRGTPEFGNDSPLYRAMGYVPKSERKSGLKRRKGRRSKKKPA